jgi:hypothetical protein
LCGCTTFADPAKPNSILCEFHEKGAEEAWNSIDTTNLTQLPLLSNIA